MDYQKQRQDQVPYFDFLETEEDKEVDQDAVAEANKLNENCCTKNLEISLYWEEKIVLILKMCQIYAIMFLFFYEQWPSKVRTYGTQIFLGVLLQFSIRDDAAWYDFITHEEHPIYFCIIYLGAIVFFSIFLMIITCP